MLKRKKPPAEPVVLLWDAGIVVFIFLFGVCNSVSVSYMALIGELVACQQLAITSSILGMISGFLYPLPSILQTTADAKLSAIF